MAINFKKISVNSVVETDDKKFLSQTEKDLVNSAFQAADVGVSLQAYDDKLKAAVALDGDLIATSDAQTLTNKTVDASANSITNIDTTMFADSIIDGDTDLAANSDTIIPTQAAVKAYVDAVSTATTGALLFKGEFDASGDAFPDGADTGCYYKISKAGTVDGVDFNIGDSIFAIVDSAKTDTYADNWLKIDSTDLISSVAGKVGDVTLEAADLTDLTATADEINYLGGTTSKVQDQLDAKIETSVLDTDATLAADDDAKIPTQKAIKSFVEISIANSNPINSTKVSDELTVDSDTITLAEAGIAIFNIYVKDEGDVAEGFVHTVATDTITFDDDSLDGKKVLVTYAI